MISKPVKWRRVGIATLAGLSLALTVLAAQASPPNAVENGAAPGTEPTAQPARRTAEPVAINPDSEAALRRTLQAAEQGRVNYEDMEPMLADAMRKQEEGIMATLKQMGAMQSITFKGGDQGWETYEVKFAHGTLNYRIAMAPNGKIAGMMVMPPP